MALLVAMREETEAIRRGGTHQGRVISMHSEITLEINQPQSERNQHALREDAREQSEMQSPSTQRAPSRAHRTHLMRDAIRCNQSAISMHSEITLESNQTQSERNQYALREHAREQSEMQSACTQRAPSRARSRAHRTHRSACMQSACKQHAISMQSDMQSACNQHAARSRAHRTHRSGPHAAP